MIVVFSSQLPLLLLVDYLAFTRVTPFSPSFRPYIVMDRIDAVVVVKVKRKIVSNVKHKFGKKTTFCILAEYFCNIFFVFFYSTSEFDRMKIACLLTVNIFFQDFLL